MGNTAGQQYFLIALLIVSADYAVKSAVVLASILGLSATIIGATIVSIGTTLPELMVNLQAVRKKNYSLAIGNTVGSTVVNSTLILGIASISPSFAITPAFPMLAVLFLSISLLASWFLHSLEITKSKALVLIAAFAVFLALSLSFDVVF